MKIGYDAKRAFANFTGLGNYARSTISNICIVFPAHEYYLYTPTKVADGASDFIHDIKKIISIIKTDQKSTFLHF